MMHENATMRRITTIIAKAMMNDDSNPNNILSRLQRPWMQHSLVWVSLLK